VKGIKKCTEAIPNHDNQNDCCIGNDQQSLDALSHHKSYENCMKDMFDIMDAFFTVPSKKIRGHIPPDIIFLFLEQMMRDKLYKSLDKYSQHIIEKLDNTFKRNILKLFSKNYLSRLSSITKDS
jgi:hypothetical protein